MLYSYDGDPLLSEMSVDEDGVDQGLVVQMKGITREDFAPRYVNKNYPAVNTAYIYFDAQDCVLQLKKAKDLVAGKYKGTFSVEPIVEGYVQPVTFVTFQMKFSKEFSDKICDPKPTTTSLNLLNIKP